MKTVSDIMLELEKLGSEQTRKVLSKHGARDFYGVKIADLKKVLKRSARDHQLALALYNTGNSDAMYLAGLMADPLQMTKEVLEHWMKGAYWYMLSEHIVAGMAAESTYGAELAAEWMESENENYEAAAWATWSGLLALGKITNTEQVSSLLWRVENTIHTRPNRVRYCMNNFVINLGCYAPDMNQKAKAAAQKIGKVEVYMGETSCKVPDALSYIEKVENRGKLGDYRKHIIS